ncbi:MAG: ADP-ribosylation factor-like protein [Candidatus Kariarchaeaceae archaeon]|jgi:small GTP-binding protein
MLSSESKTSSVEESYKIVLIGDDSTGKSWILEKLLENQVPADYDVTSFEKKLNSNKFEIWDYNKSSSLKSKKEEYYKNADGAVVIFDINSPESFKSVPNWVTEMIKYRDSMLPLVIVGNGTTPGIDKPVKKEDVLEFAYNLGDCSNCKIPYTEVRNKESPISNDILKGLLQIIECDKKDKCFDKVSIMRNLCDLQQFYEH